ncbi:MAG: maleate cis-trans isomerase [Gemmatimonadaceae bacterium]
MQRRHFVTATASGLLGVSSIPRHLWQPAEDRWQYDGAGTLARFGVLTPDFDPVPESELWAMAPRGVSIHATRVARSGRSAAGFVEAPFVDDAVDRLVELAPDAILLGYSSSSYALGADADERVRARLEQRAKGIPVIFTCPAANAAFQHLGVTRLSVVHPPWWREEWNDEGSAYWRAAGFEVLQCTRLLPLRSFSEVTAAEVFEYVARQTPRAAQAVFVGGNGMRAVGAVRALEARLGRPVLTANQVLLWEALRRSGRPAPIARYGSIFTSRGGKR